MVYRKYTKEPIPEVSAAGAKYLPDEERKGMGLCLSGGGFRAALYHLGALRRLNELGILSMMDTISSVSGGSILSAHLAAHMRPWPGPGKVFRHWEKLIAAPFREYVSKDIRTGPLLSRALPWNWFRATTQVNALSKSYKKDLIGFTLDELPSYPRFIFCATDLVFGGNWVFERKRAGDDLAGHTKEAASWPVADAVAASSCFPPFFGPWVPPLEPGSLTGGEYDEDDRDRLVRSIKLSDGGIFDNMGTEPVWRDHRMIFVSDGGAPFRFRTSRTRASLVLRYREIMSNQSVDVRKRWLISNYRSKFIEGAYWGIGSQTMSYPKMREIGYSKRLVADRISKVRTDLDKFTEAETAVLENHGYILAAAAIESHVPGLGRRDVPVHIPHGDWMDEQKVSEALKDSHRWKVLGIRPL